MAKLTLFHDIPVVPVTRVHQHVAKGGPIWPQFARQTTLRHCRDNRAWDEKPDLPDTPLIPMPEPALWGGFLDSHFGHFVADHLSRLPRALRERPEDRVLFTVDPGVTRQSLPDWAWQLFDWIGLPAAQVHLVTEPLRVQTLRAGPQAEMLRQVGPSTAYIDMIEGWATGLMPRPVDILYVSRAGIVGQGGGGFAGEAYLTGLLEQLGVAVMDPSRTRIRDQMAAYAGAERIVFAEGSALHGRQLLGWIAQDITVLRRRHDKMLAQASLRPRCRGLTYHDLGALRLMAYWKDGTQGPNRALNLYDVPQVWRVFQEFGIDLARLWDHAAYTAAAEADAAAWIALQRLTSGRLAEYQAVLVQAGLSLDKITFPTPR